MDMPTIKIQATDGWIDASAEVSERRFGDLTREQAREIAQAFAAHFPKSAGVRATSLGGADYDWDEHGKIVSGSGRNWVSAYLTFRVQLRADGVNKGVNETGVKRYRALRRHAERLGYTVEWTTPFANSLTEDELERRLSA
jgi:hypothetical protein